MGRNIKAVVIVIYSRVSDSHNTLSHQEILFCKIKKKLDSASAALECQTWRTIVLYSRLHKTRQLKV